ncbi:multicopper oxidase-domain-containing protein [Blakeslea trispora]|nr:multicopper oxidase-domain-containing protein [Blakeslea trispora]
MYLKRKIVFASVALMATSQAVLRRYELDVDEALMNPDCGADAFYSPIVNGQFPGPNLYANVGDEVEVLVKNSMASKNTSIHFHGIRQIGTNEYDGVPGITQYIIEPGDSFLHRFKIVDQAGTYFYHAHVGLQDDSVKGSFIVYESEKANPHEQSPERMLEAGPYEYDDDLVLQVSEWWHQDLSVREEYYMGPNFNRDLGAHSILLNGRTINDPDLPGVSAESCEGYATLDVEPNSVYRLRVIGSTSFRVLAMAIRDHNMTLIEIDGELIEPYNTSYLEIAPGQRYSVLIQTGDYAPGTTFSIGTSYIWRIRGGGITENGFGYLRYKEPSERRTVSDTNSYLFKPLEWVNTNTSTAEAPETPVSKASTSEAELKSQLVKKMNFLSKKDFDGIEILSEITEEDDDSDDEDSYVESHIEIHQSIARERIAINKYVSAHGDQEMEAAADQKKNATGNGNKGRPKRPGFPSQRQARFYPGLPQLPNIDQPDWMYHQIVPLEARKDWLDQTNARTIVLNTEYNKLADNRTRYSINSRVARAEFMPALERYDTMNASLLPDTNSEYNAYLDTYPVRYNEVIDLVLQNRKATFGCVLHPWHTHGHSHYVIASGTGDYDHDKDKDTRNFANPIYRDTTVAYPSLEVGPNNGCGWTKIRILADNPGFWAVHCHITTHMMQGKMIVLEEAPELIEKYRRYSD